MSAHDRLWAAGRWWIGAFFVGALLVGGCSPSTRPAGAQYEPGERLTLYAPRCSNTVSPLREASIRDERTGRILWQWTGEQFNDRVVLGNDLREGEVGLGLSALEADYMHRGLVANVRVGRQHELTFRLDDVPVDRVLLGGDPPTIKTEAEMLANPVCSDTYDGDPIPLIVVGVVALAGTGLLIGYLSRPRRHQG